MIRANQASGRHARRISEVGARSNRPSTRGAFRHVASCAATPEDARPAGASRSADGDRRRAARSLGEQL
jgi:hypothetical protein